MDSNERKMLEKMLQESDFQDNTHTIRNMQHSELIKQDVNKLLKLKQEYFNINDLSIYKKLCTTECTFLVKNYKKNICVKNLNDNFKLDTLYSDLIE